MKKHAKIFYAKSNSAYGKGKIIGIKISSYIKLVPSDTS